MKYSIDEMREKYNLLFSYFAGENEEGDKYVSSELFLQSFDIEAYYNGQMRSRFGKLVSNYNAHNRHYHTLEHIYHVLKRLEEMEADTVNRGSKFDELTWNCIKWGAWYHDYYMFSEEGDEKSSAAKALNDLPISNYTIQDIIDTIVKSTDHKKVPQDYASAILCDADLSIFAAPLEVFDKYEENIRKEYAHIPDNLFRSGRLKVLEKFYNRGKFLYHTDYGRDRWAFPALKNLEYSMKKLKG